MTLNAIRDGLAREAFAGAAFREWTVAGESVMQTVQGNAGREDVQPFLQQMADPASGTPAPVVPLRAN